MSQSSVKQSSGSSPFFRGILSFLSLLLLLPALQKSAVAQMQLVPGITTFAGNGTAGYSGDGSAATSAGLNHTEGIAVDSSGNLYIADWKNNRIRKVDASTGVITTIAGNGTAGYTGDGAAATSAELNGPTGVTLDSNGNIFIADQANNRVRKVAAGTGIITTIAGNGIAGFSGDNGAATSAELYSPTDLAFDSASNLYIADNANNRIRKVASGTGVITTYAGNGTAGFSGDSGQATSAELNSPAGLIVDASGNLYIADTANNRVRKVAVGGVITTYAGVGTAGFAGDGGAATSAELNIPARIALDKSGNLYIADQSNNRIREVFSGTGIITTLAGNGTPGFAGDGGPGTAAELNVPLGIAIDSANNFYISDYSNNRIRRLALTANNFPLTALGASSAVQNILLQTTASETITSITVQPSQGSKQEYSLGTITGCTIGASEPAGTICTIPVTFMPAYPGQRWVPLQVVTSTGNINFGLQGTGVGPLAALTPGIITTYAGNGTAGSTGDGGPATSAELNGPGGTCVDSAGNLYIAVSNTVRKVDAATGIITTVAGTGTAGYTGDGGAATSAELNNPSGVTVDSAGNLYIGDYLNYRVRKVDAATGIITTVAGSGVSGYSGDGGPATSAKLVSPAGVVFDSAGNLYIADYAGGTIRKVDAGTGIITTVAGNGTPGYSGDGGPATSAELKSPAGMSFDSAGNLYIADVQNQRVRKVTISTGIITTVAGNGTTGYSGDGGLATNAEFFYPNGAVLDGAGNLYVGDQGNARVRKVDAGTGIVTTIAGNGTGGFSGDAGPATSAQLLNPYNVALDSAGNLFITDLSNNRIRKIDISQSALQYPTPTTVGTSDSTDNPQTAIVSNIGNASLTIPPPSSGNNPSVAQNFTFNSSSTCSQLGSSSSSQTLAAGADCTIAIDFAPLHAGSITGTAVLTDMSLNVAGAVQTIQLAGTGLAASTTTTVAGSPSPSTYSQTVTFTATVSPTVGTAVPTGTVQFTVDGSNVGSPVTLSGQTASFTTSTLAVGSHTVAAVYTPDTADFTGSNGSTAQTVNKATLGQNGLADITLISSPNPSIYLQTVIFTATVPSGVTGTVQFKDGTTLLGTTAISGTTATLTTSNLAVGTHPVTAVYSGDTNYNSASSAIDNQVVNKATLGQNGLAAITITSAPNPSTYLQTVTFTASLPSGVTGTVQFVDGATVLGTSSITGTTATLATSALAVGTHPVTAVYSGDASYNSATSAIDNQVVNKATLGQNGLADIALTSSPNPSTYTQSVTFTATVPSGLTGSINFVDGQAILGTATISGTMATLSTSRLSVGTHPVTAVYSGDGSYNSATSAVDNQVVTGVPSSTTTLSVSPSSVMYGNPATLTAVVAPSFATGTVSFYEGSTLLGSASVDVTGTAVLSIGMLNAGSHNITATYNGDPAVPPSTSNTVLLTVTQRTAPDGGPAITVTVNNASRTTSQTNPPFSYSPSGQLVNGDTYVTAIGGSANYSTAAGSTPGTYSIALSGLTSANYTIAFIPGTLTVTITPTTTTLVANPDSTQYGDPVTLTATVTPGATGSVSFYDGSILLGTGTLSNGTATLTTTMLSAGTHSISAIYNGDGTYASSQSDPANVTVAKKTAADGSAALTVTIENASRQYGTSDPQFSYVVTGNLVNHDSYTTAVTGVPSYSVADTPTSSVGTIFPISVSGLNSKNYVIAFVPGALSIVPASTTITLATSATTTQYGDPVTLTATVAPNGATGTVVFMDGLTVLSTGTVSGGVATLTTSSLNAGTYTITATYEGDGNYGASTSTPVTIKVNPRTGLDGGPALTVTVNDVSRSYGVGNPAFSYTVTGTLVNGDTYATAITGVPVYSTTGTPTSPAGTYPITLAGGLGSSNYVLAFVNGTLTVSKATPGQNEVIDILLTSSPNPSIYGQLVTFTATVPNGASGTIQFMAGSTVLGTASIVGNIASFTISTLNIGTTPVTAKYSGDGNYNSVSSGVTNQVVTPLDFTLTLTSSGNQTVIPGNSASYTVQVAPTNTNYPGTVTFSATGLPPGATISFSPSTVAADGGTKPIGITVQTAAQKAALETGRVGYLAFALFLLPLASSKRMRKSSRRYFYLLLLLAGGIAASTGLTGCGYNGNGFFGKAPQTYTITITATSGSVQHSVNVTLNLQ